MSKIKTVYKKFTEGEIIAFTSCHGSLYLFTKYELIKISGEEFKELVKLEKKDRGWTLKRLRELPSIKVKEPFSDWDEI